MNINSLEGPGFANGVQNQQSQNRTPSSIPPAANQRAAATNISGPGQLFARLSQLAEQDPAKFKEVAQGIADKLHAAAAQGNGKQADFENKLADRFAQAAQSGDMSALQPQGAAGAGQAHGHHHHHHHGAGGDSTIARIFSSALEQVNQALGSSSSAPVYLSASVDRAATANAATTVTDE